MIDENELFDPNQDNDGDAEDVVKQPLRRQPTAIPVVKAIETPVGGRMALMQAAGAQSRQEFISLRTPMVATKVALPHLPVFAAIWRLWARRRALAQDPGVTMAEICEACGASRTGLQHIVATLIRNDIIRSIRTAEGYGGQKAKYFPTELGVQLFALAETLGYGTSVQVGRNRTAWGARNKDEPEGLFRHAEFLQGVERTPDEDKGNE